MSLSLILAAFLLKSAANLPDFTEVAVAPSYCFSTPQSASVSTITKVGGLQLTAKHALCKNQEALFVGPEGYDLAILRDDREGSSAGPLASCRDAAVGEPLAYFGYPGERLNGKPYGYVARRPEGDSGVMALPGVSIAACAGGEDCEAFSNVSVGSSELVRPGYSGGAVVSRLDGRLVGIISAVSADRSSTFFIPVSSICKTLEEIQ